MPPAVTPLETERLRLRPLVVSDAAFIVELLNEPGWLQYIGDRGVRTVEEARNYIMTGPLVMYAQKGVGLLAVELKESGERVGICGLIKRDNMEDIDLGYALLERYWGRGYAIEAAGAALAHGRDGLKLARIVALTAVDNARSIQLLEKLGFRFERMVGVRADGVASRLFGYSPPKTGPKA